MIIIYTGNGKGKTSACVGQAVRALGHGLKVVFVQFIKRHNVAGEQIVLKNLLGENFRAGGLGFFRHEEERSAHRQNALELFRWAAAQNCDLLTLDESLYALGAGLLLREEMETIAEAYSGDGKILVLSGRGLPEWLKPHGDIITTLESTKHAFDSGVRAAKGIEY